jgi:hypothetical protein
MIRQTCLAAAIALGAALTLGGVALAQAQTGGAAPPPATVQPAPPPAHPAPPWAQPDTFTIRFPDRIASQPIYAVDPPPEGAAGVYLPAAVLGYGKAAAGCIVIGCEDGPQVGGAPAPSPSGAAKPPPANPWLSDPR